MKKLFFLLSVFLFSLSSYVWATPVYFATDLSNSSVSLGGTTSSSWFLGSGTLDATLASSLETTTFTLNDGQSQSFDFFEFDVDAWGIVGGDFTVEATLAFSSPDGADVTGGGSGVWGSAFGLVSGGFLTWVDMPRTFTLLDGNELTISFDEGIYVSPGSSVMIQATVTNNGEAPAPVPEPATMLLLGSGLTGLALYRRKKSKV